MRSEANRQKIVNDLIAGLPGESLVREGLANLQAGKHTLAACLVAIARTRFQTAGLLPESGISYPAEAELQLYRLLRRERGDAYSRYNALLRELVSFEQALDHRRRRQH